MYADDMTFSIMKEFVERLDEGVNHTDVVVLMSHTTKVRSNL